MLHSRHSQLVGELRTKLLWKTLISCPILNYVLAGEQMEVYKVCQEDILLLHLLRTILERHTLYMVMKQDHWNQDIEELGLVIQTLNGKQLHKQTSLLTSDF